jgi:hypothetical protein
MGQNVKRASEYRAHAHECRALARQLGYGEHRDQLLSMAATWEQLAAQRDIAVRVDYLDGSCATGSGSSELLEKGENGPGPSN